LLPCDTIARYMLSSCVCLCVCHKSRVLPKRQNAGSRKQTLYDSPGILVFWCRRSQRNSNGVTPNRDAK